MSLTLLQDVDDNNLIDMEVDIAVLDDFLYVTLPRLCLEARGISTIKKEYEEEFRAFQHYTWLTLLAQLLTIVLGNHKVEEGKKLDGLTIDRFLMLTFALRLWFKDSHGVPRKSPYMFFDIKGGPAYRIDTPLKLYYIVTMSMYSVG